MIYLDNAATTMHKPQCVIDAMVEALNSMGNGGRGAHGTALKASRAVYDTRRKLAELFGCSRADHVIFTSNSTESLNIAIRGLLNPGDHVISTDLEHNSVLRPLYFMEEHCGVALDFVPANRQGLVDYADFEKQSFELKSGEIFVMASDGIAESESDSVVLLDYFNSHRERSPEELANDIIELARNEGKTDDLSTIAIKIFPSDY